MTETTRDRSLDAKLARDLIANVCDADRRLSLASRVTTDDLARSYEENVAPYEVAS